ncbi:hypothetical protein ACOSQ3_007327 [Xanthoceras sorbifolium]
MGYSSQQSLYPTLDLKGTVLQNKGILTLKPLNINGSLWSKVLKADKANMIRRQRRRIWKQMRRRSIISMKRSSRDVTESTSKRSIYISVESRIKTLQKLVSNGNISIGGGGGGGGLELDRLFGETADYIKCLQMKVKIMQMIVKLLSPWH